ncbi:MAG: hypothetical protein WC143_03010 [Eubacteriales bacterium]
MFAIDLSQLYKESMVRDDRRRTAKKKARSAISDGFFVYAAGAGLAMSLCFFVVNAIRLALFMLTPLKLNLTFFFAVIVYFLCFPLLYGGALFIYGFYLTKKVNFLLIFKYYLSWRAFYKGLQNSLLALLTLGGLAFPFAAVSALPYLIGASEKETLIFEVVSLFLAASGGLMWFSFLTYKKISRENVDFFLSFLPHYAIAYFTKGIYLIFLFPYICLSARFFKEKPQ